MKPALCLTAAAVLAVQRVYASGYAWPVVLTLYGLLGRRPCSEADVMG